MGIVDANPRPAERHPGRFIETAWTLLLRATKEPRRTEVGDLSEHLKRDIGLIDSLDPRKRR